MQTEIKFLRIFTRIQEGEEFLQSIIVYMKRPHTCKDIDMGNGQGKTVVTSWKHYLCINLWFINFKFGWIK